MENVRKLCSALSKRCCFSSEYSNTENLEVEGKSNLDVTSSQIPKIPEKFEKEEKKLTLTIIESEKMQPGKTFIINSIGLLNSERTSSGDGCVYAGSLYYEDQKIINDIILPQSEKGVGKKHFMIQYRGKDGGSFVIKDLGDGMGTFIRLTRPLPLQNNFIISFGDSHMIVVIEHSVPQRLVLKFIDGPKVDQKFKFVPDECPITIGRMSDCNIRFDDTSLSRYHCIITYQGRWLIQDGDGKKISTNGTWLFAEEFFEIYNEMLFKAGETLFRADLNL